MYRYLSALERSVCICVLPSLLHARVYLEWCDEIAGVPSVLRASGTCPDHGKTKPSTLTLNPKSWTIDPKA